VVQSEGVTDESKRQHMERLVRDELERWDSESCISSRYDPSPPSSTSGRAATHAASEPSQVPSVLYTNTCTRPFNGRLSRTTWVSRYQKGKTSLDFTEARVSEWQWHQLGYMPVCTSF